MALLQQQSRDLSLLFPAFPELRTLGISVRRNEYSMHAARLDESLESLDPRGFMSMALVNQSLEPEKFLTACDFKDYYIGDERCFAQIYENREQFRHLFSNEEAESIIFPASMIVHRNKEGGDIVTSIPAFVRTPSGFEPRLICVFGKPKHVKTRFLPKDRISILIPHPREDRA